MFLYKVGYFQIDLEKDPVLSTYETHAIYP